MTPSDTRARSLRTITFIDSASLYEVVAILEAGRRDALYPWAWRTAVILTHSLIHIELLRMAPAPSAATQASGLYRSVSEAATKASIVEPGTPDSSVSSALTETVEWAASSTADLSQRRTQLFTDTTNFVPWLQRSIRQAWAEHAARLDGLFNREFSNFIAAALNTPAADIERVRQKSLDAEYVAKLAKKMPDTDEFKLMRDAYVVSALIRGYYHQVLARNRGEHLFRHPFRADGPLPPSLDKHAKPEVVQYRYPLTPAQSAFATIVLANAKRKWRSDHRPNRWIETIRSVRRTLRKTDGSLASINLQALGLPHAGEDVGMQAARTLGIACPPAVLNMMVDFAGGVGLTSATGLALTHCPPAGVAAATLLTGGAGNLVQPSKIVFHNRLERLAKRAPGAIDYTWSEPAARLPPVV